MSHSNPLGSTMFFNGRKKITALFLSVITLSGAFFLSGQFSAEAQVRGVPTGIDLYGWAWSSNVGWISFNSRDCDADEDGLSDGIGNCPSAGSQIAPYGVVLTPSNELKGTAWSGTLGWVKFGDLSNFPTGPGTTAVNATYDTSTKQIRGWSRVCHPSITGSDCSSLKVNYKMLVSCSANPPVPRTTDTVTWSTQITGGIAPYTISWTGSQGLTGNTQNVSKNYSVNNATENATVTVTSSDGQTSSATCRVNVRNTLTNPADITPDMPAGDYCPADFSAGGAASIINFSDIFSPPTVCAVGGDSRCGLFAANNIPFRYPAGTYSIRVYLYDGDANRVNESEPDERAIIQFRKRSDEGGGLIVKTPSSQDLSDGIRSAAQVFSMIMDLPEIDNPELRVVHALYDETGAPTTGPTNKLNLGCMLVRQEFSSVPAPESNLWDGWISLRGNGYGVSINETTRELEGHAWGGTPLGWISFNCNQGGVSGNNICEQSDYDVHFGPYSYTLNAPASISVPQNSTGTIHVTGRLSRSVRPTEVIDLLVQIPGSGITLQGVPRCVPVGPGYTTCEGDISLAVAAGAQSRDVVISSNPLPTNGSQTVRVNVARAVPPYRISVSPPSVSLVTGQSVTAKITATFLDPANTNNVLPAPVGDPMPTFSTINSAPTFYTVAPTNPVTCVPSVDRRVCEATITINGLKRIGDSQLVIEGMPAPTFGAPLSLLVTVNSPRPTLNFWAVPVTLGEGDPQCGNNIDDDGDGLIDFGVGGDPGCSSREDNSEVNSSGSAPPPLAPACSDGVDNEDPEDTLVDYPDDPGCNNPSDTSEENPVTLPQCSDRIDNDSDGIIDYPSDPGCTSAADNNEFNSLNPVELAQCFDGVDNNDPEDTIADYPNDPGCDSAADGDERDPQVVHACSDGLDNDLDGFFDFPNDMGCFNAADDDEMNGGGGGTPPAPPLRGSASLSVSLTSTDFDHAGFWHIFTPPATGRVYSLPNDWEWTITVNSSIPRTITAMNVLVSGRDTWATADLRYYPLVVLDSNGNQLNFDYNHRFNIPAGTTVFRGFGQIETIQEFLGGTFNMRFSDGTFVTASIAGSLVAPEPPPEASPSPSAFPPLSTSPSPSPNPGPTASPPPEGEVTGQISLVSADENKVSLHSFTPGGNNDWHWVLNLYSAEGRIIRSASIIDGAFGYWSTTLESPITHALLFAQNGVSLNTRSAELIGPLEDRSLLVQAGNPIIRLDLYGEPFGSDTGFIGGGALHLEFTDGTVLNLSIPGSSILPDSPVPTQPSPSPAAYFDSNILKRFTLAQVNAAILKVTEDESIGYRENNVLYVPNGVHICLHWTTTNATTCTARGGSQSWPQWEGVPSRPVNASPGTGVCQNFAMNPANPTMTTNPLSNVRTTFNLSCTGPGGTSAATAIVDASAPAVVLKANNAAGRVKVPLGSKVKLSWRVLFGTFGSNGIATNCTRENGDTRWQNAGPIQVANSVVTGTYDTNPILRETTFTVRCGAINSVSSVILVPEKSGFKEI